MKEIKLTKGRVALVDDEDYERLQSFGPWQWRRSTSDKAPGYAIAWITLLFWREHSLPRRQRQFRLHMHDLVSFPPEGLDMDHIDRNGLNNCRSNLRHANKMQRVANRPATSKTGYKGIVKRPNGRWEAKIGIHKKRIHLGSFKTAENAATAYNFAAEELFGEFARFNLPL